MDRAGEQLVGATEQDIASHRSLENIERPDPSRTLGPVDHARHAVGVNKFDDDHSVWAGQAMLDLQRSLHCTRSTSHTHIRDARRARLDGIDVERVEGGLDDDKSSSVGEQGVPPTKALDDLGRVRIDHGDLNRMFGRRGLDSRLTGQFGHQALTQPAQPHHENTRRPTPLPTGRERRMIADQRSRSLLIDVEEVKAALRADVAKRAPRISSAH